MTEDRWIVKLLNKEGEAFTVRQGDHVCDFKGRCGYAVTINEVPASVDPESSILFSFNVDPGYGILIEIQFPEVAYVTKTEDGHEIV